MTPTPTTAIDAETMAKAREAYHAPFRAALDSAPVNEVVASIARAIQAEKAEADHFKSHFQKLARVNAEADHALDTARREWAKRGEG